MIKKQIIVKKIKKRPRSLMERRIENFVLRQIEMYVKIHKEHEKDLSYIG